MVRFSSSVLREPAMIGVGQYRYLRMWSRSSWLLMQLRTRSLPTSVMLSLALLFMAASLSMVTGMMQRARALLVLLMGLNYNWLRHRDGLFGSQLASWAGFERYRFMPPAKIELRGLWEIDRR